MDSWWVNKSREELIAEARRRQVARENKEVSKAIMGLRAIHRSQREDFASRQKGGRARAAQFLAAERRA